MHATDYEPRVGDVIGVLDVTGCERTGRIVVHTMWDNDPEPWLVAFPSDVGPDAWMDDGVQRVWFSTDRLRLIDRPIPVEEADHA